MAFIRGPPPGLGVWAITRPVHKSAPTQDVVIKIPPTLAALGRDSSIVLMIISFPPDSQSRMGTVCSWVGGWFKTMRFGVIGHNEMQDQLAKVLGAANRREHSVLVFL